MAERPKFVIRDAPVQPCAEELLLRYCNSTVRPANPYVGRIVFDPSKIIETKENESGSVRD